jgi:hypothetical protein
MTKSELKAYLTENGSIGGVCIRLVWTWMVNGQSVTRAANSLLKSGEAQASYYAGGRGELHIRHSS